MEKTLIDDLKILLPSKVSVCGNPSTDLARGIDNYLAVVKDDSLVNSLVQCEVHEAFSSCCIHFLNRCCNQPVTEDQLPLFSVYQEGQLKTCLEFIISLGIYPLLDEGVAFPLELRMEYFKEFKCPHHSNSTNRYEKLASITGCLLHLRECKIDQLTRLVSTSSLFLGDLIAAVMQLSYGVNRQQHNGNFTGEDCREWRRRLWQLLCQLPGYVAMRELIILQGGLRNPGKQAKNGGVSLPVAPMWLRKSSGSLLSRLLLRLSLAEPPATGVQQLIMAAASLAPGLAEPMDDVIYSLDPRLQPALATSLACILAACPAACASTKATGDDADQSRLDVYRRSIADQILEILERSRTTDRTSSSVRESSDSMKRFSRLVSLQTIHVLSSRDADAARRLLTWPLIEPLRRCVLPGGEVPLDHSDLGQSFDDAELCTLASSNELATAMDNYIELLTCQTPSPYVLEELVSYSQPLFNLLVEVTAAATTTTIQSDDLTGAAEMPDIEVNREETEGIFERQRVDPELVSLRQQLLTILSRLLLTVSGSRLHSVRLIRSWLSLHSLPDSFLPGNSDVEAISSLPLSCHQRLLFRRRRLVALADVDGSRGFGYRAVMTRQALPPVAFQTARLPALISATLDLLRCTCAGGIEALIVSPPKGDQSDEVIPPSLLQFAGSTDGRLPREKALIADLFLTLVSDLNCSIARCVSRVCKGVKLPHDLEIGDSDGGQDSQLDTLSSLLAAAMLDTLGSHVWPQDPGQAVSLFRLSVNRIHWSLEHTGDNEEMKDFVVEMLSQLLGILAFYVEQLGSLSTSAIPTSVRDEFQQLLPCLKKLRRVLPDEAPRKESTRGPLVQLLDYLIVALATRGAVSLVSLIDQPEAGISSPTNTADSGVKDPAPCESIPRSLIEEIPESSPVSPANLPMDTRLADIFNQLKDPFIPVRGHALIELSRLLEARDPCCRGFEDKIHECLLHQLTHDDSYVYLSAIRALTGLGACLTDSVLKSLLRRLFVVSPVLDVGPMGPPNRTDRVEFRLKVSEAVMRILRGLGAMAPKYREQVLQTMLAVARHDPEPLIRAASLSNITELCGLLGHSLQPYVYELLSLIERHLTNDPSVSVRCAAANLARGLLSPVQSEALALSGFRCDLILPADILRDLNRLLSTRSVVENDDEVREQLEAALGALHYRTCKSLFPDQKLTPSSLVKNIQVLRPFD